MENVEILKRCTKCGEWKPRTAEYFHRNKYRTDGFEYKCKSCINAAYKPKKRDYKRTWQLRKARMEKDPGYRQKKLEAAKIQNKKAREKLEQDPEALEAHRLKQRIYEKERRPHRIMPDEQRALRNSRKRAIRQRPEMKEYNAKYKREAKARTFLFDMLAVTGTLT